MTELSAAKTGAELDDLMLAMDVVDTLRHQQTLVEHALSADERDAALTARIRKIYSDQGITVTDEVIANGVKALREERFSYRAPPAGIKTWFAKCYVQRSRAYKPIAVVLAALGVWWGAHFAFSTLPAQRELAAAMETYNQRAVGQHNTLASLDERLARATGAVATERAVPLEMLDFVRSIRADADTRIGSAKRLLKDLKAKTSAVYTDIADYADERSKIEAKATEQIRLITQAQQTVKDIEQQVKLLALASSLPVETRDLVKAIADVAKEPAPNQLAQNHAENALAALRGRDAKGAERERTNLQQLFTEVKNEYQILIVSRPGERSGIWRHPEANGAVRNYYLVVEAVTKDGARLTRPVVSEEDGKTHQVSRWAMRVDKATYDAVAADKGDDGIVQNKFFGSKKRGYLNPEYAMSTTGASIISW